MVNPQFHTFVQGPAVDTRCHYQDRRELRFGVILWEPCLKPEKEHHR